MPLYVRAARVKWLKESMDVNMFNRRSNAMSSTVAQMSKQELEEMISNAVEEKLIELFGDPDGGLSMKEDLRRRLRRQKRAVAKGDRGTDLSTLRKQIGL